MQRKYNETFAILNTFEHALSINPLNQPPICRDISLRVFHNQTYTDTKISIIYHPQFHAFSLYNHQDRNIPNDSYNSVIFQKIGTNKGFMSIADVEHSIREIFPDIHLPITMTYTPKDIANPHIHVQYNTMHDKTLKIFQPDMHHFLPDYIGKYQDTYTHIAPKIPISTRIFSPNTPLSHIHEILLHQSSIITQKFSMQPSDKLHINHIEHFLPPIYYNEEHIHLSICVFTPSDESTSTPSGDNIIWYRLYANNEQKTFGPIAHKSNGIQQNDQNIVHDIYKQAVKDIQNMNQKWSNHTQIFFLRGLQQQLEEQSNDITLTIQRICNMLHHHYIYTHFPARYPKKS